MKIVKHDCPLVEMATKEGLDLYVSIAKKWPFDEYVNNEHIVYAMVFSLVRMYSQRLEREMSKQEFVSFIKELLEAHL